MGFPGSKRCGCRSVESASFKSPGYWNGRKQEDFLYGNVSQLLATCKSGPKLQKNCEMGTDEPYYDDYFAIWDTFRATHPLFTLLTPSVQTDMIRSLIDIYKHDGYMPDARSGNDNGRVQGGTDCDILIADAMVKGLKNIDYETALQSMVKMQK